MSLNKLSQSVDAIFEDGYGTVLIGRAERKGYSSANAKSAFTAYKKFLAPRGVVVCVCSGGALPRRASRK
jgi:hypothetical protein